MNLFLDDLRVPSKITHAWHDGRWTEFPSCHAWVIVRSYNEFVKIILEHGCPVRVSLDHDLADEHYPSENISDSIDYNKFREKTGLDCAEWLTTYCLSKNLNLPDWYVHSFNPIGRENIIRHLRQFNRFKNMYK